MKKGRPKKYTCKNKEKNTKNISKPLQYLATLTQHDRNKALQKASSEVNGGTKRPEQCMFSSTAGLWNGEKLDNKEGASVSFRVRGCAGCLRTLSTDMMPRQMGTDRGAEV